MLKWNQNAILSLRRSTWEPKKEPSILPFNLMTSTLLNLSVAVFCIGRKMCVGGRGVGVKEKSHVCTCFLQMPAAPAPLPSSAQTPWRWRWVTFVPRSPWAWLGLTWTLNPVCGEVQGSEGLGGGKILRSALNPSLELSPAVKRRGGVWVCVLGWGRVALEVHRWMDRKGPGGGGVGWDFTNSERDDVRAGGPPANTGKQSAESAPSERGADVQPALDLLQNR